MNYSEVVAEFLYGCFKVGLCVELFVVKLVRDLFAYVVHGLDAWCESGTSQMALLAGRSAARASLPATRRMATGSSRVGPVLSLRMRRCSSHEAAWSRWQTTPIG